MSTDREIEKLLDGARVTTTPEQDERVLAGAAMALPRPGRVRRLLPRFLAAAVLIGIVLGGFTARGVRDAAEEKPLEVASAQIAPHDAAIEVPSDAVIALNFNRRPLGPAGPQGGPQNFSGQDINLTPSGGFGFKIDGAQAGGGGGGGGQAARVTALPPEFKSVQAARVPYGRANMPEKITSLPILKIPGVRVVDQWLRQGEQPPGDLGVGGARGAMRIYDHLRVDPELMTDQLRAAYAKVNRTWAIEMGDIGVNVRGLGGEEGPLVNLDDITNGLEGTEKEFIENEWHRRYGDATSIGREEYDRIREKPFLDPRAAPLSTFGIDVDTASYANVRRFLMSGQLPPPDAVRIEEMVNYFTYDYPQPEGDAPFSVVTEVATCPWNPGHRLVHIGIQGKRIERGEIPPRNLVFLLDVSGSMKSTNKLPLVKSAMKLLVGELGQTDHVSIVTYAGTSGVALKPTNCGDRPAVLAAIGALNAGGSTNAGSGIQLAYEMARRNYRKDSINRVILATDGDFNVGITDRQALEALITKERDAGVFLTVLGVGTGNLKDSQLEMLADKGNGNYAYLDSILEAQKVLVREAGATMVTIAKDVKIQVEFNPKQVGGYRLIGYENRMLAARDFNDDKKDAGEIGAGHSVTALYEIAPPGEMPAARPAVDPLRYQDVPAEIPAEVNEEHSSEVFVLKLRYKRPDADESSLLTYARTDPGPVPVARASESFNFASAVATFGMLLRRSEAARDISFALVEEIAAGAIGRDPEGERAEFLKLVKVAAGLAE